MSDDDMTTGEIVASMIARWDEMRRGPGGDGAFRTWFFETLPQLANLQHDPDTHAFMSFEVAVGLFERGRQADAFQMLSWFGRAFTVGREPDIVVRAVMSVTDTVVGRVVDAHSNARARQVLREVIDTAGKSGDVHVERAVCRALANLAYLRTEPEAPTDNKYADLVALWRELGRRARGSDDPELRWRQPFALFNEALTWLQDGQERRARQLFSTVVSEFGAEPAGSDPEFDRYVAMARHAGYVLDAFDVGAPEFALDYLRRQRYWDYRRVLREFPQWLRAGLPRNQMRGLVRRAQQTHERSVGAVRTWLCSGEPFVLLLRGFEQTERSGVSARPDLLFEPEAGDHVQMISFMASDKVLTEFAAKMPLVCVASTTAAQLEYGSSFGQFTAPFRLYLPDATWFETVSTLIAVADQIIVWASELTPGVARELAELTARGRAGDTLVLLEPPSNDPFGDVVLPRAAGEPLAADHPALAGFPHIVDATGLRDRTVAECPPLLDVVRRLNAANEIPYDQRLASLRDRLAATMPGSNRDETRPR
jgi:hypothetical protein